MKPISLVLQAFGPYMGREEIDFTRLAQEDGKFLIYGKTGSGKTMILDGITFALYGSPRKGGDARTKLDELRTNRLNNADSKVDTVVSFVFELNGVTYKFERSLVKARIKFNEHHMAYTMNSAGVFEPLFEKEDERLINAKAEELLGLTREQFRQVIVLPQGKFEQFLVSKSEEKEAILSSIFDTDRWKGIADRFYANAQAENNRYEDIRKETRIILQSVEQETAEGFAQTVAEGKTALGEMEKAFKEAHYDEEEKRLDEQKTQVDLWNRYEAQQKRQAELIAQTEEIKAREGKLALATKADKVKPHWDECQRLKTEIGKDEKEIERTCTELLPVLENSGADAQSALEKHGENAPQAKAWESEATLLEAKREVYGDLSKKESANNTAASMSEKATAAAKAAQAALDRKKEEFTSVSGAYTHAQTLTGEYTRRYIAGIGGTLAQELEEGKPCPVCGSTHHPNKAPMAEDAVTKEQLDEQRKKEETAKAAFDRCDGEVKTLQTKLEEKRTDETQAAQAAMLAAQALEEAKKQLVEGIADSKALEAKIKALQEQVKKYEEQGKKLAEKAEKAEKELTKVKAAVEEKGKALAEKRENLQKAEQKLTEALLNEGFGAGEDITALLMTPDEKKALTDTIAAHAAALKECARQIEELKPQLSQEKPDGEKIAARRVEIADARKKYATDHAMLEQRLTGWAGQLQRLQKLEAEYEAGYRQAASDLSFAKVLRGDSSVGLQRYVLAVMFESVLAEANRMLEHVHDGRYRLIRVDDKGAGNKRGLELKVFDAYSATNEPRSVDLLSGGEKFLVSLALAIGMSAVAQQGGTKIDAMFIDEGFGTLDEQSIEDAMGVLDSIQKSNGVVGIISHVQLLRDAIPSKIEVEKHEKTGSHIRVV